MGRVSIDKSISLDGYITGPNPGKAQPLGGGGEAIFAWMMTPQPESALKGNGVSHLTYALTRPPHKDDPVSETRWLP